MTRLEPEIDLLNPQEGSRRLEPLEQQVSDHQNLAKSLNVEYKHSLMNDLNEDAQKLDEKGEKAVDEMEKVGKKIFPVCFNWMALSKFLFEDLKFFQNGGLSFLGAYSAFSCILSFQSF